MRTKWMIALIGISVTLSLLVIGCGGGKSESIGTPAAGGTSGVMSTQDRSQTGDGEEAGNTNTTANESGKGSKMSSIPVPIVRTKSMLQGEEMPFEVGFNKNLGSGQPWTNHIAVVRSYSELKTLYESDQNMNKELETEDNRFQYIQGYDDEFFKENALIVLFREGSSGFETHTIESLVKQDKTLCIHMRIRGQGDDIWTSDMADFRTLIEIKQADIQDVTDIVVYNSEQCENVKTLPGGKTASP